MLVLSRKSKQTIVLGGSENSERTVKVTVLEIKHGHVKLGFEAPGDVRIHRCEILDRLESSEPAGKTSGDDATPSIKW